LHLFEIYKLNGMYNTFMTIFFLEVLKWPLNDRIEINPESCWENL